MKAGLEFKNLFQPMLTGPKAELLIRRRGSPLTLVYTFAEGSLAQPTDTSKAKRIGYPGLASKTGPASYDVDRSILAKIAADPAALDDQATTIPDYLKGEFKGVKLVGVRGGSVFRELGIRSRDVLVAINGKALKAGFAFKDLFPPMLTGPKAELQIRRGAMLLTLVYTFRYEVGAKDGEE